MKVRIITSFKKTALLAALLVEVPLAAAQTDGKPWWPQFHGPNRDNVSTETGLWKQWPQAGPKLIWDCSQCGHGFSMVAIADGKIFTAGDFDEREMVIALDLDGKVLWKSENGASWTGPYPGSRTTPTYDHGVLYHMNPHGRLTSFQAASGEPIWSVDLQAEFGGRYGTWAMAENIVIDGDRLFCTPGGSKALLAALDKNTGKTLWTNTDLDEVAAYCTPAIVTYRGVRQLITLTQKSVVCVETETGKMLWSHPHVTPHDQNVNRPLFDDGYVYVATGHRGGSTLLKIDRDLHGVAEVWSRKELDNCHGGVMLLGGCLYGSACRHGGKAFFCADFLTGRTRQSDKTLGKLSLTFADGMLYGISDRGRMVLLAVAPGEFSIVSEFKIPKHGDGYCLAHPVICGGRLYLRHGDHLYAYDIRAR